MALDMKTSGLWMEGAVHLVRPEVFIGLLTSSITRDGTPSVIQLSPSINWPYYSAEKMKINNATIAKTPTIVQIKPLPRMIPPFRETSWGFDPTLRGSGLEPGPMVTALSFNGCRSGTLFKD